jgi:hypothetical protein
MATAICVQSSVLPGFCAISAVAEAGCALAEIITIMVAADHFLFYVCEVN